MDSRTKAWIAGANPIFSPRTYDDSDDQQLVCIIFDRNDLSVVYIKAQNKKAEKQGINLAFLPTQPL